MGKDSKKNYYTMTSTQIRNQFDEVCHKLGLEIGNERRAITNQEKLKELQEELEEAFSAAVVREQENKAKKERAESNTKAFEEKSKENQEASGTQTSPQ